VLFGFGLHVSIPPLSSLALYDMKLVSLPSSSPLSNSKNPVWQKTKPEYDTPCAEKQISPFCGIQNYCTACVDRRGASKQAPPPTVRVEGKQWKKSMVNILWVLDSMYVLFQASQYLDIKFRSLHH
jgi:hypothetical protein